MKEIILKDVINDVNQLLSIINKLDNNTSSIKEHAERYNKILRNAKECEDCTDIIYEMKSLNYYSPNISNHSISVHLISLQGEIL